MNHDQRRVAIVRAWLLTLVTVILACFNPLASVVVASNLPAVAGLWMSCCAQLCNSCESGILPDQIQLDFSGVTDNGAFHPCDTGDCDTNWNTSFVLDFVGVNTLTQMGVSAQSCLYQFIPDEPICYWLTTSPFQESNIDAITLEFIDLGADYRIFVFLQPTPVGTGVTYEDSSHGSTKIDCDGLVSHDIPFLNQPPSDQPTFSCIFTSSSLAATSL